MGFVRNEFEWGLFKCESKNCGDLFWVQRDEGLQRRGWPCPMCGFFNKFSKEDLVFLKGLRLEDEVGLRG